MFKKIEIWILYLVLLLFFPFAIIFGVLVRQELVGNVKAGGISKTALFFAEIPKNIKLLLIKPTLLKDSYPELNGGFNGIPNSNESYILLSRYDGDMKEGIVELISLKDFKVLHTWNPNLDEFNKIVGNKNEFRYLKRDHHEKRSIITHPLLNQNGDLFVHRNGTPLAKIDACSSLIFQKDIDHFHHSIERDVEGNLWVPSWIYPQTLPIRKVGRKNMFELGYYDDAIVKLSPSGEILFEKSVSQIFIDNGLEYLLFALAEYDNDPIHLNDIQPVEFDGQFWNKGDVFLSLRNQSMVLLYRPSTNKIIWKGTGPFFHQHDVDILNDHTISIFNNNSKSFVNAEFIDGQNEVILYDFKKKQYSSYLKNSFIKNNIKTAFEGRSEILPNGDLFIEESNLGRTIYFNSDGSLRWQHYNRASDGRIYRLGWSRILYTMKDIKHVRNFLNKKVKCND